MTLQIHENLETLADTISLLEQQVKTKKKNEQYFCNLLR